MKHKSWCVWKKLVSAMCVCISCADGLVRRLGLCACLSFQFTSGMQFWTMAKVWVIGSARRTAHILNKNQNVMQKNSVIKKTEDKKQVVKMLSMSSPSLCRAIVKKQVVKMPLMRSPSPRRVFACLFTPAFTRERRGTGGITGHIWAGDVIL